MTEKTPDPDQSPTLDESAALYARARLQGTRYWDFSASRQEVQGKFRHRIAREHAERAVAGFSRPIFGQLDEREFQTAPAQLTDSSAPATALDAETPSGELVNFPTADPTPTSRSGPHAVPAPKPQLPPHSTGQTRWYALHAVLGRPTPVSEPPRALPLFSEQRPPMLAVLSSAGGVGKTCVVATLGRALSDLGENILLADTNATGLLPYYYGARPSRPGVVRTFSPPVAPSSAFRSQPVQLLSLQTDRYPNDDDDYDPLLQKLLRDTRTISRVLVDVPTAHWNIAARLLAWQPTVLVPLLADIASIASLEPLQARLANQRCFYFLNQFDPSSALHLDVRAMLQQHLGDRLLPGVVRRNSAVDESLSEGLTVIDYAPDSPAAEDYRSLADWLRTVASPAMHDAGVRWSER